MKNYLNSSTVTSSAYPKSVRWTIFGVVCFVIICALILPCSAKDEDASEIFEAASANTEKYRKADAAISFTTQSVKPIKDGDCKITLKRKDGGVHTFNIHVSTKEGNRWEFKL